MSVQGQDAGDGGAAIGGPIADGVLHVTALSADRKATLDLVLTVRIPYRALTC